MRSMLLLLIVVLLAGAAACTTEATETVVEPIDLPQPPPPEAGMATVAGKVFSTTTNAPLANFDVRLAEVVRVDDPEVGDDLFVLDQAFSPGAVTDLNGVFIVENVEAMEYVIVVSDGERDFEVIQDGAGNSIVWDALPDQILNVGVLNVKLARLGY